MDLWLLSWSQAPKPRSPPPQRPRQRPKAQPPRRGRQRQSSQPRQPRHLRSQRSPWRRFWRSNHIWVGCLDDPAHVLLEFVGADSSSKDHSVTPPITALHRSDDVMIVLCDYSTRLKNWVAKSDTGIVWWVTGKHLVWLVCFFRLEFTLKQWPCWERSRDSSDKAGRGVRKASWGGWVGKALLNLSRNKTPKIDQRSSMGMDPLEPLRIFASSWGPLMIWFLLFLPLPPPNSHCFKVHTFCQRCEALWGYAEPWFRALGALLLARVFWGVKRVPWAPMGRSSRRAIPNSSFRGFWLDATGIPEESYHLILTCLGFQSVWKDGWTEEVKSFWPFTEWKRGCASHCSMVWAHSVLQPNGTISMGWFQWMKIASAMEKDGTSQRNGGVLIGCTLDDFWRQVIVVEPGRMELEWRKLRGSWEQVSMPQQGIFWYFGHQ